MNKKDCPYLDHKCGEHAQCSRCTEHFEHKKLTPYERTKAQVYATGNKWAIENFHATHD